MPVFDQETRDELKAIVKEAIAESGGVVVSNGDGNTGPDPWPYPEGQLMSTPDDLGRVKLKVVEVDLMKKYGGRYVPYVELTVAGPVNKQAYIPEWYFVPDLRGTEFWTETAQVAVGSAAFYQNRAYPLITKEVRNGFFGTKKVKEPDLDSQLMDTFASQFTVAQLTQMLPHLADRIAEGKSAYTMYNMPADELTIG